MKVEERLTDNAKKAIALANRFREKNAIKYFSSEIILVGILSIDCVAKDILNDYGVTLTTFLPRLRSELKSNIDTEGFTPKAKRLLMYSFELADSCGCGFIATEHILLAVLKTPDSVAHSLVKSIATDIAGLTNDLSRKVYPLGIQKNIPSQQKQFNNTTEKNDIINYNSQPGVSISSSYDLLPLSEDCPLNGFGFDLTLKAKQGKLDPVVGRKIEINRLIETLSRRLKNTPLLIGEPGIGKSAVVEGLAQKVVSGDVPSTLFGKRIFSLDVSGLLAGAKFRGEFEERFKKAVDYAKQSNEIILFIDEIHNLMCAGAGADGMSATEIIKPSLARGELQLIGATTVSEYRKYIEKDSALARRFLTIMVEPPSETECVEIIKGLRDNFEAHHQVKITDDAIKAAVTLSERYITDRFLPDKAIDLIDEAAAHRRLILCTPKADVVRKENEVRRLVEERNYAVRQEKNVILLDEQIVKLNSELDELYEFEIQRKRDDGQMIVSDDIAKVVSEITQIPVARLTESESEKLLKLEKELAKRVIGQRLAVEGVAKAVRRARACVKEENRPIGSFIFVGPTGVGKTELSKALSEVVFGDEKMLIRIDMSEYMEKAGISKLIGAPPGYVGYDEEGQLTEKVRRKPFSVVLFDEIEKAHNDVFNLLLQILDDGRLTDSKGRLINFKNTIIIMTSNTGARECVSSRLENLSVEEKTKTIQIKITEALKKQFKPEFLNRVDDIIIFDILTKNECERIAALLIEKLKNRLIAQDIRLELTKSAMDFILDLGYDEEYGARPLKRVIQKQIEDAISEKIISGEIKRGDKITAVKDGNIIRFI